MDLKVSDNYIMRLVLLKILQLSSLLSFKRRMKITYNLIEYLPQLAITFD